MLLDVNCNIHIHDILYHVTISSQAFSKTNSINFVNVNFSCNKRKVITERRENVNKTAFKKSER